MPKKCSKALYIVKFLGGTWWGSHPSTLLTFYKIYVRSIIEYGAFLYFPKQKKSIEKLERVQYAAIRSVLGLAKSTPTNILIAESKLLYLEDRVTFLCECFIAQVFANQESFTFRSIKNYYTAIRKKPLIKKRIITQVICDFIKKQQQIISQNKINIYSFKYRTLFTSIPVNTNFGLSLSGTGNPNVLIQQLVKEHDALAIYTDGSKSISFPNVGSSCVYAQK